MQVTEKNIHKLIGKIIETKGLDISDLRHNPEKDVKLVTVSGKSIWKAEFKKKSATGNILSYLNLFIDAVTGEATIRQG